jgi:hypothetical protein
VVLPPNLLKTFAVNSMRDMQLLRDILKKCKAEGDHQISVCRFAARYGSGGQPLKGPQGGGFLTVQHAHTYPPHTLANVFFFFAPQLLFTSHPAFTFLLCLHC